MNKILDNKIAWLIVAGLLSSFIGFFSSRITTYLNTPQEIVRLNTELETINKELMMLKAQTGTIEAITMKTDRSLEVLVKVLEVKGVIK